MSAEGFEKLRERVEGFSSLKDQATKLIAEERRNRKEPRYGKMPDRLIGSTEVSPDAKLLFACLHSLSAEKRLSLRPVIAVSLRELCRRLSQKESMVRVWVKELVRTGWIDVIRPGFREVNKYRLYESSRIDREAPTKLAEANRRIVRDRKLRDRLKPIKS